MSLSETLIVQMTWLFGLLITATTVILIIQKLSRNLFSAHDDIRRRYFAPYIEAYVCGDDEALQHLRTASFSDKRLILEFLIQTAENLGGDFHTRARIACHTLGYVPWQIGQLNSWRWWMRADAAYHLGLMGSPLAIEGLTKALKDTSREVRLTAIRSLAEIQGIDCLKTILTHFADMSRWAGLELAEICLRIGPSSVPLLLDILKTDSLDARLLAVELLGYLKDRRAIEDLKRCLRMPDADLRIKAAQALSLIGEPSYLTSLIVLTGDPFWKVRLVACEAIGRIGGPESIPVLSRRLKDPDKYVRIKAAEVLEQLGELGAEALRAAA